MKHTKGPWYEASTGNHQALIVAEDTGENIAVAYDKKNAAIIASVPDMLEACEAIKAIIDNYWLHNYMKDNPASGMINEITELLETAIRKTEGE